MTSGKSNKKRTKLSECCDNIIICLTVILTIFLVVNGLSEFLLCSAKNPFIRLAAHIIGFVSKISQSNGWTIHINEAIINLSKSVVYFKGELLTVFKLYI